MYEYVNEEQTAIRRLSDGATIPVAPGNRDYQAVLEWVAEGNTITPWTPPPISSAQVNAERDARMSTFTFNGKEYDLREDNGSLANVSGAGTLALAAIVNGAQPNDLRWADPASDFVWIANDNSLNAMDAQTTLQFSQAAAARRQFIIFKARAIKDMDPIPTDYKNNSYWE